MYAPFGPWTALISSQTTVNQGNNSSFTQMYATFLTEDAFRFSIAPVTFLRKIGKWLGFLTDVEIGFPDFDEAFLISGTDTKRLQAFFADAAFRGRFQARPNFKLEVHDKPWPFAFGQEPYFPPDVDILHLWVPVADLDAATMKALYDLFVATMEELCRLGTARREPSGVEPWGPWGSGLPKFQPPPSPAKPPGLDL